jgi:transcription elongation factor Elf1
MKLIPIVPCPQCHHVVGIRKETLKLGSYVFQITCQMCGSKAKKAEVKLA